MNTDLEVAIAAAQAGARMVKEAFGAPGRVRLKGPVNPVTDTDTQAEQLISSIITRERPGDRILAEESAERFDLEGRVWIVDPLDGTVNFTRGIPQVAVSIALYEEGKPVVAAVADVLRDELYEAAAGHGSRLNDTLVTVGNRRLLSEAVIATGFPYDRDQRGRQYAAIAGAVLEQAQGLRRFGAAALDLAWVAAGRLDGYWEFGLAPWDIAAGMLLITEAGGLVTGLEGGPVGVDEPLYIAANPEIHRQLLTVLTDSMPPGWPPRR